MNIYAKIKKTKTPVVLVGRTKLFLCYVVFAFNKEIKKNFIFVRMSKSESSPLEKTKGWKKRNLGAT